MTDFYVWQWQDEKGQWNPYSTTVSLDLEDARESSTATVSFEAFHRSYSIDMSKMKQVNTVTNVERVVERGKSGKQLSEPVCLIVSVCYCLIMSVCYCLSHRVCLLLSVGPEVCIREGAGMWMIRVNSQLLYKHK